MAGNERWWRNDPDERGWQDGERDMRDLGRHRDYGRDMLNDMRRYARGDRDDWRREIGRRDDAGRGDYSRMGYERSGYDYGRGGHYGGTGAGSRGGDRGFLERAGDEMSSWFGDEDAERRRRLDAWRGDPGAQHHGHHHGGYYGEGEHHRGRGPRGYTRSDERIREDINDRLTDDPYLDASDIEVTVSAAEVTLSGSVEDRRAKRRAEDIAESVSGARHVQNNLRVRQMMGGMMGSGTPDAALGAAASTTRPASPAGAARDYDTRTTGVVGDMNAPADLHTADTDSITRR